LTSEGPGSPYGQAYNRPTVPKPKKTKEDLKSTYARIRKPMPPAERVERDRRRAIKEEQSKREIDELLRESRQAND
jgi:hypothetical protein